MQLTDHQIPEEIRAVERDIDAHHLSNPLMQHPFATAAWWFFAACEDLGFLEIFRPGSISNQETAAIADNLIVHTKRPLRWISSACAQGGIIPSEYDPALYAAASQLFRHSMDYHAFEMAFTYATYGLLNLELEGRIIKTTGPMRHDARFEAYDRLTSSSGDDQEVDIERFFGQIAASVQIKDDWFTYEMSPKLVESGLEALAPTFDDRFVLPPDWQLPDYSIGQFARVARVLHVLGYIHFRARITAASFGCVGMGIARALIVMDYPELIRRLCRYSGLEDNIVRAIVRDLTYGSREQINPDPALQPIVPLTTSTLAISPSLVINSSMERNLVVLQNRLSDGREAYAALSQEKEALSRQSIIDALSPLGFRFWHGDVPLWGDASQLDLAIISDTEARCLILELKSFIAPADPREIRDRSEEIQRGIEQTLLRSNMAQVRPTPLQTALGINDNYQITWAVASDTSIGAVYVQNDNVPVIKTRHLLANIRQNSSLSSCCRWLEKREYLPTEGTHYDEFETTVEVGGWTVEWYGIQNLVDNYV